jgi:hypothetical protein
MDKYKMRIKQEIKESKSGENKKKKSRRKRQQ